MKKTPVKVGNEMRPMKKLRYVFTDPEGAKKNLDVVEDLLEQLGDRVSIDVFDETGTKSTIKSLKDIPKWMQEQ